MSQAAVPEGEWDEDVDRVHHRDAQYVPSLSDPCLPPQMTRIPHHPDDNHLQPNYYSFINEFMRVLAPNSPAVDETEVVETLVNAVTLSESFNRRGGLLE